MTSAPSTLSPEQDIIIDSLSFLIAAMPGVTLPRNGTLSHDAEGAFVWPQFDAHPKISNGQDLRINLALPLYSIFRAHLDRFYTRLPFSETALEGKPRVSAFYEKTDLTTIQAETYRLLSVIRNAVVHESATITSTSHRFHVSSLQTSSRETIEADGTFLTHLLSLTAFIVHLKGRESAYAQGLARTLYREMRNSLGTFQDKHGATLATLPHDALYLRRYRCRVEFPNFSLDDTSIEIRRVPETHQILDRSPDYMINHKGIQYLIPDELLYKSSRIEKKELQLWKYDPALLKNGSCCS